MPATERVDLSEDELNTLLSSIEQELQQREQDVATLVDSNLNADGSISDHERNRCEEQTGPCASHPAANFRLASEAQLSLAQLNDATTEVRWFVVAEGRGPAHATTQVILSIDELFGESIESQWRRFVPLPLCPPSTHPLKGAHWCVAGTCSSGRCTSTTRSQC